MPSSARPQSHPAMTTRKGAMPCGSRPGKALDSLPPRFVHGATRTGPLPCRALVAGWQSGSIRFPARIFSYKETPSDLFHKLLHARVRHLDEMVKAGACHFWCTVAMRATSQGSRPPGSCVSRQAVPCRSYHVRAAHHRPLYTTSGQPPGKLARPGRTRRVGVALRHPGPNLSSPRTRRAGERPPVAFPWRWCR
jgi:hypothetical protein